MYPRVDYDTIASSYDRRYLDNDYSGVEKSLIGFVGQNPVDRVLEIGCGTGHWLQLLAGKGIRATGLDVSSRMLARAHAQDPRSALVRGVAEQLPWADRSFDRLFCVNALHHFSDTRTFLAEARRVLGRGGRFMTVGLDPHTELDGRPFIIASRDARRRRASARSDRVQVVSKPLAAPVARLESLIVNHSSPDPRIRRSVIRDE